MGEEYRARDTNLERDVAIKVLPGNKRALVLTGVLLVGAAAVGLPWSEFRRRFGWSFPPGYGSGGRPELETVHMYLDWLSEVEERLQ